jgi:hypothetical protein
MQLAGMIPQPGRNVKFRPSFQAATSLVMVGDPCYVRSIFGKNNQAGYNTRRELIQVNGVNMVV